ncbi:uncharacterized protein LOC132704054 isoform X3 [Cylas formicarius]|uniref:uncharacterized protein LOC132704054 isoform X3 n=1 Tax=Cylas formicarius TaxID=197179 RepID=UPI002958370F|nr:uncharacterized protein LOC132704054 isoform X3 [Cylas formicarius]
MSDPTIQTFCCRRGNGSDVANVIVDAFDANVYNVACVCSSLLGALGAIYQILPRTQSRGRSKLVSHTESRGRKIVTWLAMADLAAAIGTEKVKKNKSISSSLYFLVNSSSVVTVSGVLARSLSWMSHGSILSTTVDSPTIMFCVGTSVPSDRVDGARHFDGRRPLPPLLPERQLSRGRVPRRDRPQSSPELPGDVRPDPGGHGGKSVGVLLLPSGPPADRIRHVRSVHRKRTRNRPRDQVQVRRHQRSLLRVLAAQSGQRSDGVGVTGGVSRSVLGPGVVRYGLHEPTTGVPQLPRV